MIDVRKGPQEGRCSTKWRHKEKSAAQEENRNTHLMTWNDSHPLLWKRWPDGSSDGTSSSSCLQLHRTVHIQGMQMQASCYGQCQPAWSPWVMGCLLWNCQVTTSYQWTPAVTVGKPSIHLWSLLFIYLQFSASTLFCTILDFLSCFWHCCFGAFPFYHSAASCK